MSEIRKIGRRIGEDLKIWLPGETPWSIVERIHSDGTLSVKINNDLVLTDEHGYKFADIVRVEQEVTPEYSIWKVIAPESVDEALVTPAPQAQDKVADPGSEAGTRLIEQLRDMVEHDVEPNSLMNQAAAALEAQQAEIARLREERDDLKELLDRAGQCNGYVPGAYRNTMIEKGSQESLREGLLTWWRWADETRAALAEPGS